MKRFIIQKASAVFNVVIPIEYKKINGIFLYGAGVNGGQISLSVYGKTIIPKGFDAALIEFTGFIKRDDVLYPLNMPNSSQALSFECTTNGAGDIYVYFDVE